MMDAVSFADILFFLLVCIVTGGILIWVNRQRATGEKKDAEADEPSTKNVSEDKFQSADEDI